MKASRNHIRCLFARERKQSSQTTNTLAWRIKAARAKYRFIYAASPFIVSEPVSQMIAIFVYLWKHCCHDRHQWLSVGGKSSRRSGEKGSGLLPECSFIKHPHFPRRAFDLSFIVFFSVLICAVWRRVLQTSDLPITTVALGNNAGT